MLIPLRRRIAALTFSLLFFSNSYAQTINKLSEAVGDQQTHADVQPPVVSGDVIINGPLRSFLRMAGISQKVSADEILPLLARNVYVQGYQGWQEKGRPTEFLILLGRYVNQAKELAGLAGPDGAIHVSSCDQFGPLLRILGYRLRSACGQNDASLITEDAERAFLTTDSGFPLPALEESLRHATEFVYHYPESRVPALFSESDWIGALKPSNRRSSGLVEALIRNPLLSRLYWAFSRLDPETRTSLKESVGLKKLLPFAGDLDFYGAEISIRAGRVQVPGGVSTEAAWNDLVGSSPESPAEFVPKLLAK